MTEIKSFSKKAIVKPIYGPEALEKVVNKALTDDTEDAEQLLSSFLPNVRRLDILNEIVKVCDESKFTKPISRQMLSFMDDPFRLWSANATIDFVNKLTSRIRSGEDQDKRPGIRNLAFLLAHTLGSVHLLAFDKLREVVVDLLPKVIKKLWDKERKDEACLLARQLICVHMIQHEYSDSRDDLDDDMAYIWANAGFDESYLSSPVLRFLFGMLTRSDDALTELKLLKMSKKDLCVWDKEMDARAQLASVIGVFLPNAVDMTVFPDAVRYLVSYHVANQSVDKLSLVINECAHVMSANQEPLWNSLSNAMCAELSPSLLSVAPSAEVYLNELEDGGDEPGRKKVKKEEETGASGILEHKIAILSVLELVRVPLLTSEVKRKLVFILLATILEANFFNKKHIVLRILPVLSALLTEIGSGDKSTTISAGLQEHLIERLTDGKLQILKKQNLRGMSDAIALFLVSFPSMRKAFVERAVKNVDDYDELHKIFVISVIIRMMVSVPTTSNLVSGDLAHIVFDSKKASASGCLIDSIAPLAKGNLQNVREMLLDEEKKSDVLRIAFDLVSCESSDVDAKKIGVQFISGPAMGIVAPEKGQKSHVDRLLDWTTLAGLCALDESLLEPIMRKAEPEKLVELVESFPDHWETEHLHSALGVIRALLSAKLQPFSDRLQEPLSKILMMAAGWPGAVGLATNAILAVTEPKKNVRSLVSMAISVAAIQPNPISQDPVDAKPVKSAKLLDEMCTFLVTLLKNAKPFVEHDQCAVFAQLFGHHLNQVGAFCEIYKDEVDLVNRLRDGCNRVVQAVAKESTFFEKTIPGIIGSSVLKWSALPVVFVRLCSLMDFSLSACLATNLPPAEKRAFARLVEVVKKANKKLV